MTAILWRRAHSFRRANIEPVRPDGVLTSDMQAMASSLKGQDFAALHLRNAPPPAAQFKRCSKVTRNQNRPPSSKAWKSPPHGRR